MIKLTPSSIGVMVDTLRYSGRDRYIIFRMKTREQKIVYMRYPQHFENMANQENMIVIVDAQKFLPLWQRSPYAVDKNTCAGDESTWRKDYKFHFAENGFAKSMDSPVPLADVNVHIKDGEISCSLNDEDDESQQTLPTLVQGQVCQIVDSEMKTQQTSPPAHFTEGTLLTAMKNAARFVTDERLKQRLRETEGLGTEATRAGTIQGLIDKGFLKKKGKQLLATEEAMTLIDNLPQMLKDPGLTALWEQALNQIAERSLSLDVFMQKQETFVRHLMADCLKRGMRMGNIEIRHCPQCGAPLAKRNGKNGPFWGCTAYPNCQYIENIGNKKSTKGGRKAPSKSVSEQISGLRNLLN